MPRTVRDPLTYSICEKRWSEAPKRQREANTVKLAPNTVLVVCGSYALPGAYAVRFHGTDILTFEHDGSVTYDTGGYRTATTRERMNRFGPEGVYVRHGTWYITAPGRNLVFADGHVSRAAPPVLSQYLTADVLGLVNTVRRGAHWSLYPVLADALADAGAPDALTDELRGPVPGRAVAALCAAVPAHSFAC